MAKKIHTPDNYKLYLNIYEMTKHMTDEQAGQFFKAISSVNFLEVHIDDISFTDQLLSAIWSGVKVQINKQVHGYCSSKKAHYINVIKGATEPPPKGAKQGATEPPPKQSQSQSKTQSKPKTQSEPQSKVVTQSYHDATIIADYLYGKIVGWKPNLKSKPLGWVKDIDKAIRLDNRTKEELIGAIDWIYTPQGSFWQSNILSGDKLRDKFDTMEAQMMKGNHGNSRNNQISENLKMMQEVRNA